MRASLVVALAVPFVTAFFGSGATAKEYSTGRVERGTVAVTVTATGTVQPVSTVQVGSQASGTISWIGADFNTPVKRGQVIARLDPATVEIVGELDHLSTITSDSFIVPYVGLLPARPHDLIPNPTEVDRVLHVALAELLDPEVYREERWDLFGAERSIFFFELHGDTVWGATAAMLRQLLGLATGTLGRGDLAHE